jgi:hypothetical protein
MNNILGVGNIISKFRRFDRNGDGQVIAHLTLLTTL